MATLLAMNDFVEADAIAGPRNRPQALSEIDVRSEILEDLTLKILNLFGSLSILEIAKKTCLSYEIANDLFYRLRTKQLCQVTGMTGNVPEIVITSQGRTRATELLSLNHYTGAAPVSLESYTETVRRQSVKNVQVRSHDVERAFAHLVMDNETLRKLGTALNSGSALFLYGPAGTGKTSIAETLSRVLAEDEVWIPYAVEVDGQIITVYDPSIHARVQEREPEVRDKRWVLCHRPSLLVGGELTAEMVDLQFNPNLKYYVGPVQMKANNGVLIVDDFGRQKNSPGRTVKPLDRSS